MENNFVYNQYVMGDTDYHEDQENRQAQVWDYYALYQDEEIEEIDVSD